MAKSVQKGKRGEVEFCAWLEKNELAPPTERNYNQSWGGADIIIEDFCFEVKRREVLDLDSWWYQVVIARKKHEVKEGRPLVPVVCFRQNRKPWEFLIPAAYIGCDKGYLRVKEKVFVEFAKRVIEGAPLPLLVE